MALNQNSWEKTSKTFKEFIQFTTVFKNTSFTDESDENSDCVIKSIQPCFLNLIRSPTPPYGELVDKNLEATFSATIKDCWTSTFKYKKG